MEGRHCCAEERPEENIPFGNLHLKCAEKIKLIWVGGGSLRFCACNRFKPKAEQHSDGPPPPRTPKNRQGTNEVRIMNTLAAAESTSRSHVLRLSVAVDFSYPRHKFKVSSINQRKYL